MPVSDAVIDDISQRIDLVELIGRVTPLKRAGRHWKGRCPFHHEKTPSFTVSTDKQLYYCFGCQAGGNAFTFVMQTQQLTFPEALEQLAGHVGVTIERSPMATRERSEKQTIAATNQVALRYFQESLSSAQGAAARAYMTKRGISEAAAQQFGLGYAPDAWEGLLQYAAAKQVGPQQLAAAGLVIPRTTGRDGFYDRFRGRLMFPIHDAQGHVIGFGGRALAADQEPKYMNSPETALFVKGKHLFGLHHAKQAIADAGHALCVEGYMDCLMLHQHGIRHAVAPLGVALTSDHARLVKRYTQDIVLLFDADDAGATATLRSLDTLVAEGLTVRIARLPESKDPDEFVLAHGAAALNTCIASAQSLFDYKLAALRRERPRQALEDRVAMCHAMLETVRRIPDQVLQRAYAQRLAEALQLDVHSIHAALAAGRSQHRPAPTVTAAASARMSDAPSRSAEVLLIGVLLDQPELIPATFARIAPAQFTDPQARAVAERLQQLVAAGTAVSAQHVLAQTDDPLLAACVAQAAHLAEACASKQQALDDCFTRLESHQRAQQLDRLHARIQDAERSGQHAELQELLRSHAKLTKRGDDAHGKPESESVVQQAR